MGWETRLLVHISSLIADEIFNKTKFRNSLVFDRNSIIDVNMPQDRMFNYQICLCENHPTLLWDVFCTENCWTWNRRVACALGGKPR